MDASVPHTNTLYRSKLLYFSDDPAQHGDAACHYWSDGALWVEGDRIRACGDADAVCAQVPAHTEIKLLPHHLIVPGFIDTHSHYPQTEVIASHGKQLLDWLNNYTFPAEEKFADEHYARRMADVYLEELLRNGTTSAMIFATVHEAATTAIFEAAEHRNMRVIAGKVVMDQHAPAALCDTPQQAYDESQRLIETWHQRGRLHYAITPRFAVTSSTAQLEAMGALKDRFPDTFVQSHIAENPAEVEWVKTLHLHAQDYTDVFDQQGLLGAHTTLAHGIYLNARERARLAETRTRIAFCPTSNLFLGSGLLNLDQLHQAGVPTSIATDVGGGTSFSMLRTLHEAYKVLQLQGQALCPLQAFYMATLGNARSLCLDQYIGSLDTGKEADFLVLDLHGTDLLKLKQARCQSLQESLFALMMLGDDRTVAATFVAGKQLYGAPL